jgi:hypothetical protein
LGRGKSLVCSAPIEDFGKMGVLDLVIRPSEFIALLRLKKKVGEWKKRSAAQERDADWEFCYEMLNKVSRSFAIVIEQLGDELRNAICIFYLVLRGLDTVGIFAIFAVISPTHMSYLMDWLQRMICRLTSIRRRNCCLISTNLLSKKGLL